MATPAGTVLAATKVTADGAVAHSWEDTAGQNVWEHAVVEDEHGRIIVDAGDSVSQAIRKRRKRLELNDYAQRHARVVRDMIRYVYVLLDASRWMRQKDPAIPPGMRIEVAISVLRTFCQEFYDQNPVSHLGFVCIQRGEAELVTPLSSNSQTHLLALQAVLQMALREPASGGEFSLQNGLEVAGRSLGHQPRHGSREIVILTAALSTCDPGNILTETLPKLKQAKIRVSCFALSAELAVCRKIAEETGGTMGVCLDRAHFRDWLYGQTVPPPSLKQQQQLLQSCDMVPMGFPTRTVSDIPELVHATRDKTLLTRTAFTCPQCQAQNSTIPTDCAVCGLKLVLAPHLARSFHHLFPVAPFVEIPYEISSSSSSKKSTRDVTSSSSPTPAVSSSAAASAAGTKNHHALDDALVVDSVDDDTVCYACLRPLLAALYETASSTSTIKNNKNSKSGNDTDLFLRFQCPDCHNFFCVDCDVYLHDTLHNCPGCLSLW